MTLSRNDCFGTAKSGCIEIVPDTRVRVERHSGGAIMVCRFETTQSRRLRSPLIAVLAAVAALMSLAPEVLARQARPALLQEATAPRVAGEPIMAIVSIKTQQITFYDADGWILRAPVSTGTKGYETPAGVFAIVEKKKDHRSNMYDDAWMPHMQRITWNGIALHGGPLPGYAASHGCVRMPFGFAESSSKDADRDAGDHRSERHSAGRHFPPGTTGAESGGARGCARASRPPRA